MTQRHKITALYRLNNKHGNLIPADHFLKMASALVAAALVVVCLVHAASAGTTFTHTKNTDWLAVWA